MGVSSRRLQPSEATRRFWGPCSKAPPSTQGLTVTFGFHPEPMTPPQTSRVAAAQFPPPSTHPRDLLSELKVVVQVVPFLRTLSFGQ